MKGMQASGNGSALLAKQDRDTFTGLDAKANEVTSYGLYN